MSGLQLNLRKATKHPAQPGRAGFPNTLFARIWIHFLAHEISHQSLTSKSLDLAYSYIGCVDQAKTNFMGETNEVQKDVRVRKPTVGGATYGLRRIDYDSRAGCAGCNC
jgi:hypothetical protein